MLILQGELKLSIRMTQPEASAQPKATAARDADDARTAGYRKVFKSSSLLGGSQVISYLLGIIRTKALAYLLGPSGIGLLSLYTSIAGSVGNFAGMGIGESSVREIAAAKGSGAPRRCDVSAKVVRRWCLLSGLLALLICMLFGAPISQLVFGNTNRGASVALLGIALLLGAMTSAEMSLIQGSGQVAKLAKLSILSSLASMVPIVSIYIWMGVDGVIPALLLGAMLTYVLARISSRGIFDSKARVSWKETFRSGKDLLSLGFAFMLTGMVWTGKDMLIRSSMTSSYGLDATGMYQAAWAISGLFVNFVLRAMGMDFYPRLTAMNQDPSAMREAVSQQIEIGILLALPGVIATIGFSPLIIRLLYTAEFAPASVLLTVLACGVFFKVLSYPLNTIQLAMGDSKGFGAFGLVFGVFELGISYLLLYNFGVVGLAVAFPISTLLHLFAMLCVGRNLIDYRPEKSLLILLTVSLACISACLLMFFVTSSITEIVMAFLFALGSTIFSARNLAKRLGSDHRLVVFAMRIPFGRLLFS
jgi:PST family polysaccharide transporter